MRLARKRLPEDTLDFALAFAEGPENAGEERRRRADEEEAGPAPKLPLRSGPLPVRSNMVRIALQSSVTSAVFYTPSSVAIRSRSFRRAPQARGRIAIKIPRLRDAEVDISTGGAGSFRAALPCTLLAPTRHSFFEYGDNSYRGSIILGRSREQGMPVVNYLHVEDYLRGVVPLEIGKRDKSDVEAVKAQAVAARTYTYRRMDERAAHPFDMLPDVSDQVYGGVNAEHAVSDLAVRETADRVLVFGDSIILAYYHSTCGGRTANIEDVWDKPPQPYLRSVRDVDKSGWAYCSISRYYSWEEAWSTAALSDIVARFGPLAFPSQPRPSGRITGLTVRHRYACGRVGACRIETTRGRCDYGGDRIRFALRRDLAGYPILRSARFSVKSIDRTTVRLSGRGYGHGVGMCQMGAIGRARAGQTYTEILGAYYTGAVVREVVVR